MNTSLRFLCVVLLSALGASSCKSKKIAEPSEHVAAVDDDSSVATPEEGEFLDNASYRFRITKPGDDWKLQERQEIQQLTSDAQAGLSQRNGLIGVVIVERSSGMKLEGMADLIIGAMPLENKQILERELVEYVGLPTVAYKLTGSVNDVAMDYYGRIFLRENYAYQLVAFAVRGAATQASLDELFASFTLTEGKIEGKTELSEQVDTQGVGWRVVDGVFESAVSGLRVRPSGNWRTVIGAEARRVNAEAEVVLVSAEPEAYLVVLPERVGDAKPEVYRKDRIEQATAAMQGEVSQEEYSHTFLGNELTMSTLRGSAAPWTFEMAVAFDQGWAIQATGWYSESYGEVGKAAVLTALDGITRMSESEIKDLRTELLAAPDQQNQVGANYSLRAGVFEDYEHRVRWTKPPGFWEVSVGHAARDVNPIAQLYGRYQNSDAHLLLVAETLGPGQTSESYHKLAYEGVRANLDLRTKGGARPSRIGSGKALTTESSTGAGGIALFYQVTTAVRDGEGVQLHIWGPSGTSQHKQALAQAMQNLELLAELPATQKRGNRFVDNRLGYSLEMPVQFRYLDATPAEIAGVGSFATWGVDGQDWVGILALCIIEEGQDHDWSMNFMEERVEDSYRELLKGLKPSRRDSELFGRPARHLIWKNADLRLDAYLFRKGKTIYALLATDKDRGTTMRDRAISSFQFL